MDLEDVQKDKLNPTEVKYDGAEWSKRKYKNYQESLESVKFIGHLLRNKDFVTNII